MVRALREFVIVEEGGVVRLRSDQLPAGARVELIVLMKEQPQSAGTGAAKGPRRSWRDFAGIFSSGDPDANNNERIDADLSRDAK
jgi:hypothetical protein